MPTTTTTAEVGHGGKEPQPSWRSDGFRGRLISPDYADYDIALCSLERCHRRRPRLIARCIGTTVVVRPCVSPVTTIWRLPYGVEATTWQAPPFATTGSPSTSRRSRPCAVDLAGRRAWVQGGALWGDVDSETQVVRSSHHRRNRESPPALAGSPSAGASAG